MPEKREDIRILKTNRSLMEALYSLLERRSFNQITIGDLCEQAQISRTTFYTHYCDKYDLLRFTLKGLHSDNEREPAEVLLDICNYYLNEQPRVLKNLLEDANAETCLLLHDFLISIINAAGQTKSVKSMFCAGGVMAFIMRCSLQKEPGFQGMLDEFFQLLHSFLRDSIN